MNTRLLWIIAKLLVILIHTSYTDRNSYFMWEKRIESINTELQIMEDENNEQ